MTKLSAPGGLPMERGGRQDGGQHMSHQPASPRLESRPRKATVPTRVQEPLSEAWGQAGPWPQGENRAGAPTCCSAQGSLPSARNGKFRGG